ncbi:MAG: hypothetical protein N2C14_24625 [Planctomycetales bacterium]
MTEAEQAGFFAKWGDDIQAVVATGFHKVDTSLRRILFLQEASSGISSMTACLELEREFQAEEINHFRFFCSVLLQEPCRGIGSILFGSWDEPDKTNGTAAPNDQVAGIKHGIGEGNWESCRKLEDTTFTEAKVVAKGGRTGQDQVRLISARYDKGWLIRTSPTLRLVDFSDAVLEIFLNKSLADKAKTIHLYSNEYKLQEIPMTDCWISEEPPDVKVPVDFSDEKLRDPWVVVQPQKRPFHFSGETPIRTSLPSEVQNSLSSD